jgi:hypothetical protein
MGYRGFFPSNTFKGFLREIFEVAHEFFFRLDLDSFTVEEQIHPVFERPMV